MSRYLHLLLLSLFALSLQPGLAQDSEDDDEDTDIEINEFDDEDEPGGMSEEELEEIRKKNAGLAGSGPKDDGDPNAPKLKQNLQEQVNAAIKRGVEWLKKAQNEDGSWDPVTANRDYATGEDVGVRVRDELGTTAWSIYTLAKCGVKRTDPVIKKGLKYIFDETEYSFDELGGEPQRGDDGRQSPSRSSPRNLTTYETAAIIMMIEAVFEKSAKLTGKQSERRLYSDNPLKPPSKSKIPKKIWKYMHNRILWLTTGRRGGGGRGRTIIGLQATQGDNKGGWRYGQGNDADLSATQFALLALRAASQAGYPVEKTSNDVWVSAANYVKACQRGDGGFVYQLGNPKTTGSMAACGIACLVICKEQMELAGQTPPSWIDERIKMGLDWLDANFAIDRNPGNAGHHFYYLYGVERVGDLTGRREFGGKDWYVRGAQMLIAQQAGDGQWTDGTAFPPHNVNGTCFALLFLKRATVPTVTISGN